MKSQISYVIIKVIKEFVIMITKHEQMLKNVCKGFILQCGINKVNEISIKDLIEVSAEVTKAHGIKVSYKVEEGQIESEEMIQAILHCVAGGYIHSFENSFNRPFYIYYRGEEAKHIFQRLKDKEQACAKDLFKAYSDRVGAKSNHRSNEKSGLNK